MRRSAHMYSPPKRMFWPVTASIATTLAAFLPLMFWPGIPGKFMRYLPVTVFTVLTGSLLYALVFGPVLGTLFGKAGSRDANSMETLKQLEEGDPRKLKSLTGLYARVLGYATRYAVLTMGITLTVLFATFWAYGEFGKGLIFFSEAEPKFANVAVRARGNLSVTEINKLVQEVEQQVLEVPGIMSITSSTLLPGRPSREGGMDRIGQLFIELLDENDRDRSSTQIFEEIRERTDGFPGVTVEVKKMQQGPPAGKPILIEFLISQQSRARTCRHPGCGIYRGEHARGARHRRFAFAAGTGVEAHRGPGPGRSVRRRCQPGRHRCAAHHQRCEGRRIPPGPF